MSTATVTAITARKLDLKTRRLAIIDRLYTRAEETLSRLEADTFKALVHERGGAETTAELDFVPSTCERDLAIAISTWLTCAAKLESLDADNGLDAARSMLGELGKALGLTPAGE